MIAAALSASFWLAGVALAAEKPPSKDAVKDPKAAAQKVIPKQVTKADSSAAATAAAAKAFEKVSAELYPKAKQEGNLVVYSVWDVEHLRVITEAFMKRYPGIKATYWQGRNPEIVTRALTEFQGGQASLDVVLSDNAPPVIRAAGAIMTYETVQKDVLYLHDPTMPTVSLQIQALAYNTKKMKPADLPKSWEEVANPKYKGMIALDDPMRAGPLSSMLVGLEDSMERRCALQQLRERTESAERAGAQEHERDVSAGDLRRVRDLHAGAAARCHGRNAQRHAGGLCKDRSAGVVPAPSRHLCEGAESQCGEAFCRMADLRRGAENHRFDRPRIFAQRFQIEDLDRIGLRQRRKASAGYRYSCFSKIRRNGSIPL